MMIYLFYVLLQTVVSKLILVESIFRHGARGPLSYQYLLDKDRILRTKELTNVGLRQQFNLGQLMRTKYILQEQLIAPQYDSSQIYVKSTDVNRTIVSALAQLQGLFPGGTGPVLNKSIDTSLLVPPNTGAIDSLSNDTNALPNQIQITPLHIQGIDQDYVLKSYDRRTCQVNDFYFKKLLDSELNKEIIRNMTDIFQWIQQQFNVKLTDQNRTLYTIVNVFDNYYVNKYQNMSWYLHEDNYLFKKIKYGFYFGYLYLLYSSPEQLKVYNSELFEQLYDNMISRINNKTQTKMYLYSAHDTNILSVMVALNLTNWQCIYNQFYDIPNTDYCLDFPTYASNFQFELHQQDQQYFVQIVYNSQPIRLKQCTYNYKCTLEQFRTIQQSFYIDDFESVCKQLANQSQNVNATQTIVIVILSLLILILIIATVYLSIRLKNTLQKQSRNYKDMNEYI